jgi:hypothetical protein
VADNGLRHRRPKEFVQYLLREWHMQYTGKTKMARIIHPIYRKESSKYLSFEGVNIGNY